MAKEVPQLPGLVKHEHSLIDTVKTQKKCYNKSVTKL